MPKVTIRTMPNLCSEINGYDMNAVKQGQNATILASALFRLGLVCWSFCFVGVLCSCGVI